jgi:hypothetical protein
MMVTCLKAESGYTVHDQLLETFKSDDGVLAGVALAPADPSTDEGLIEFKDRNFHIKFGRGFDDKTPEGFKNILDWRLKYAPYTKNSLNITAKDFVNQAGILGGQHCDVIKIQAQTFDFQDTLLYFHNKAIILAPSDSPSLVRALILEHCNSMPCVLMRGKIDFSQIDNIFSGHSTEQQFYIKGARVTVIFDMAKAQALQTLVTEAVEKTENVSDS